MIQIPAQVRVHNLPMPRSQKLLDFSDGVQRALPGSIRVLLRLQVGLEDRLQDHHHSPLHHAIPNRWNP